MSPAVLKVAIVSIIAATLSFALANESTAARPEKEVGVYTLDFAFPSGNQGLILIAHVEDASGNPAVDGVVVFQFCSYKGVQPSESEAPSSACADGSGIWRNLRARVPMTTNGDALLNYDAVLPGSNVIGFRYTYTHGTVIADWQIDPVDWIRP